MSSVSIGIGVTIPIVIIFVVVVVVCGLLGRRRRLARIQLTTPVVNNAVSTSVVVTGSNTQTATAYPMQQSMDQKPQYSNQVPPKICMRILNYRSIMTISCACVVELKHNSIAQS